MSEKYHIWLHAPTEEALKLQRSLPDVLLKIVAEGQRSGKPEVVADEIRTA
jgi:hypothetical protein